MTWTSSESVNAAPSWAPASMVGVKTVNPRSTTASEMKDLRACRGTGVTG